MAIEKTFKVGADTSDAEKNLKDTAKGFDNVADSAEEATDAIKDNTDAVEDNNDAQQESEKNQSKLLGAIKGVGAGVAKLTQGMTGFGLAVKATGVKLLIDGINFLKEAFMNTQPAMDLVEKISIGISIAFEKVFDAVSNSNVSFEATGKVLGALLKGSLNVLVLSLESIKLGVLVAQRAWVNSFFGSKDPDKLKALNEEIDETKAKLKETANDLGENAKSVASNFVDAVGEIASGVTEIAGNAIEAIQSIDVKEVTAQAEKVLKLRKQAEEANVRITKIQQEYQGLIEKAESAQNEENLSLAKREELAKEAARLRIESLEKQKQQLKIQAESLRIQAEISGKDEDRLAFQEAMNEVSQIEADINSEKLVLDEELRDIGIERRDANIEAGERAIELAELENEQNLIGIRSEEKRLQIEKDNITEIRNLRLAALDEQMAQLDVESELYKQLADEKLLIEQDYQNQVQQLDDDTKIVKRENQNELQEMQFDMALAGFDAVASLAEAFASEDEDRAKKAFMIQKRLSQGQAIVATAQAIVGALKAEGADGLLPFPVRVANAAIAGAMGLAQVATIQRTQFGGDTGDVDLPTAPSRRPQFNMVGTSGINQLAQSVSQDKPLRAYVVGSDVTTQQELDRKKVTTSSFG